MSRLKDAESPFTVEHCFGLVEIEGKTCGVGDCDSLPVAVYPVRTSEEGAGVWWFCEEHTDKFLSERLDEGGNAYLAEVSPTCRAGTDAPCGAAATEVAILGVRHATGEADVAALSVCSRHARGRLGTE